MTNTTHVVFPNMLSRLIACFLRSMHWRVHRCYQNVIKVTNKVKLFSGTFLKYWLSYWGRDKTITALPMASNSYSCVKFLVSLFKFHWNILLEVQLTINDLSFRQFFGAEQATRHSLQWRHDGCHSVSNHQPHHCLLNRLPKHRSQKTSKLRVTGLCDRWIPRTNGQ